MPRDVRELGVGDGAAALDEQLEQAELHRRELDRAVVDAEHAAVDALAQIEGGALAAW